jgi:hypothetical protein
MKCPHCVGEQPYVVALGAGAVVPFDPSTVDRIQCCQSGGHRHCALHRHANNSLSLAIEQEVARAIG